MRADRRTSLAVVAACVAFAGGCGKKPAGESAEATASASATAGVMPPVAADWDQLLPNVPAGYTACTESTFDPRIDETTAAARTKAWQTEAASFKPLLHPVDVRAASGSRDDDNTPDSTRPPGIARFTVPKGVLEMRFPGRLSTIRTARSKAQPQFEHQPGDPGDYVLAPLGQDTRVMVGDGWISRGTSGTDASMTLEVFLVKESVEETARILESHVKRAVAAITCALEEGRHQRGAYRVAASTEPDGAAFLDLGATAGSFCEPGVRWGELVGMRRVGDTTVVMACHVYGEPSQALCKSALRAVQLR